MSATGDNPERLIAQSHDGQVRLEPAALPKDRCVDNFPGIDIHLAHDDVLQGIQGTRACHVENGKGSKVNDPRAITHRQMFGVDDGRPPPRLPLGSSRHDPIAILGQQRFVRRVPVRSLPPRCFVEHSTQRFLPKVVGREPDVPVR
jgi:hypothetical protein